MLAGHAIFREVQPGRFELTPAAQLLRAGTPGSLRDAKTMIGDLTGDLSWWDAVGQLRHSVATGEPAFEHVTGVGFFDYLGRHPEAGRWEQPQVAQAANIANQAAIAARVRIAAADFFESVPAGHGAYTLKRILHDWSDAHCVRILRRCREAIGVGKGKVMVIDAVVPPGNDYHPSKDMDILMMLLAGGRERSAGEFEQDCENALPALRGNIDWSW